MDVPWHCLLRERPNTHPHIHDLFKMWMNKLFNQIKRIPHLLNYKVLDWLWVKYVSLTVHPFWSRKAELCPALKIQQRSCMSVRLVRSSQWQYCICWVHMAFVREAAVCLKPARLHILTQFWRWAISRSGEGEFAKIILLPGKKKIYFLLLLWKKTHFVLVFEQTVVPNTPQEHSSTTKDKYHSSCWMILRLTGRWPRALTPVPAPIFILWGFFCVLFSCVGGDEDNVLWIAMAGTHQIWALFLADGKLPKGRWETSTWLPWPLRNIFW